jgi:hypothetical protein
MKALNHETLPSEHGEREERQDRTTCSNQKRAHLREIDKVNEDLAEKQGA